MPESTYHPAFLDAMADLDSLEPDIRAQIEEVGAKTGFVPNVFLKLALRPAEFRAFFAYYDALMVKESGLTKAEREMIVVVTSAANNCLYCVVAHGAILRIYSKNPRLSDQLATNYLMAELSPRQRAICDFALKVALRAHTLGDEDYAPLHEIGLSDDDIWDVGAIAAFFGLSNRMAGLTGMAPNPEFYAMARG
ncbi:MAG: peroxidase-related enzyme [Actinomycetota bacterium]|nr:peroxidase-related enzyme [Actinomycetota bacterium]